MRALQYFFSEAAREPVAQPPRGAALDADHRRRPVRPRLLPDGQRQHPAHRRALERRRRARGLPARRRAAGAGRAVNEMLDEERARRLASSTSRRTTRGASSRRTFRTSRPPRPASSATRSPRRSRFGSMPDAQASTGAVENMTPCSTASAASPTCATTAPGSPG